MEKSASGAKAKNSAWGVYAKITGILIVINVLLVLAGTYSVYPTAAHRETAHRLSEMSTKVIADDGKTPYYETSAYKSLSDSPEARYITTADIAVGVTSFLVSIVVVGGVYNYLRKNHVTKSGKEVGATVATNLFATVLSWLVTLPIVTSLSGTNMPALSSIVFMFVAFVVFGAVLFFIIARIFEWQYNRKHSMAVE